MDIPLYIIGCVSGTYDCTAPGRQPLRPAATRLASGSVRVCCVHHRSLVLDPDRPTAELVMTATEVVSKHGKLVPEPRITPGAV
jgi:hypothetical protein